MGKSQKKKMMRRHNPMRVPDSHLPQGLASASSTSTKNEVILPIIQKMDSADASERKWACVAVSNLIQNDPSTRRLLQGKNVVGALIKRLTDSEEEVLVEAAGALRNLCIDGGYDICAEMYNKNILTPWKTFVPKISATLAQYLKNPKSAPEIAQRLVYDFADNVITVFWCLSETSNKALNAINEIGLVPFLMSFLASRARLPLSPVTSAAQCLYILTDDNEAAISYIRADAGYLSCLFEIVKNDPKPTDVADLRATLLRVLASGILRNISPIPPPSTVSSVDIDKDLILPLLQPVITFISLSDASNRAQELVQKESSALKIERLSLKNTPGSDHKSEAEVELERLEERLRTVQLALEILTGTCATLPEPDLSVIDDFEDDDENMEDDDDEDENGPGSGIDEHEVVMLTDNSEKPTSASFLPTLVSPLLSLIKPSTLSFPPLAAPSLYPPITSAISAIHISALECLNNIFLSMATVPNSAVSADTASGLTVWNEIWSALAIVGTEGGLGQERRREMWDVAVGVLWGVASVWKGSITPNEEQINTLIQFCQTSNDHHVRVKCIGTLECIAQRPESINSNKIIADFLISALPSESSAPLGVEPTIQLLSALIDIYSDENLPYDVNFRLGDYLSKLTASVGGVKRLVKSIDRRKESDLKRRAEGVRDNLVAFIKYRRNLQ